VAMQPLRAITMGGGGEEDRYTYVLASLLQDEMVARAFASSLLALTPSAGMVVDVQQGVEAGRVDLRFSAGNVHAIVEVKVAADLHGQQIGAYARDVARHPGGRLYVLTPSTRLASIVALARSTVTTLESPASDVIVEGISWQAVADFMMRMEEAGADLSPAQRVYFKDFADLILAAIEGDRRPFVTDEIEMIKEGSIADYSERLEMVLVEVLTRVRAAFPGNSNRLPTGGRGFLGAGISLGEYSAWFGILGAAWRENGGTPFWIQTRPRLPGWDGFAAARDLPKSTARRGIQETVIPVSLAQTDRLLDDVVTTVTANAMMILAALPDAYRAAGAPALVIEDESLTAEGLSEGELTPPSVDSQ
jgi:hypothetical protein